MTPWDSTQFVSCKVSQKKDFHFTVPHCHSPSNWELQLCNRTTTSGQHLCFISYHQHCYASQSKMLSIAFVWGVLKKNAAWRIAISHVCMVCWCLLAFTNGKNVNQHKKMRQRRFTCHLSEESLSGDKMSESVKLQKGLHSAATSQVTSSHQCIENVSTSTQC